MWEFIAFMLFGATMFCCGILAGQGYASRAGYLMHEGQLYRVTKIEDRD